MRTDFEGKQVVVTGATGGLGAAVVETLLARGATLYLPVRGGAAPDLADSQRARVHTGIDVTDEAAVERYYATIPELWGSIHLVGGFAMGPVTDTRLATFEQMWSMNAVSCFLCCREAIRAMRGGGGGGRIVNVTARPVERPASGLVAYTASKAAVAATTRCLAEEVTGDGILVNAVAPSVIDTPQNRAAMPGADHAAWPKPAQIAAAIAFLASPDNALTSGAVVPVYGAA